MCDHTDGYNVFTRVAGYSRTRVYQCHRCGSMMAMDTLPQYLLKRMFGDILPVEVNQELPPVDLCVVFSGLIAPLLSRVFFWSLQHTTAMYGVTLHLVNIDVPLDEFSDIVRMSPRCEVYARPSVPAKLAHRTNNWLGIDAEWSSNWAVENCGSNQFVVLSHFDLFFMRDFLTYLRKRVTPKTGMLGQHCPFVILNREAYAQSCFKFRSEGPFRAVLREDNQGEFFLYHPNDPRAASSTLQTGFDNGELLELELRILGWGVDSMRTEFDRHFYHFSGGGRVLGGDELTSLRNRARMFIEEYSI